MGWRTIHSPFTIPKSLVPPSWRKSQERPASNVMTCEVAEHAYNKLSGLPSAPYRVPDAGAVHDGPGICVFVGLIILIGIVKKNLMWVDFAQNADLRGRPDRRALHHDHDGRAAGRGADCPGLRRPRGAATAGCWRGLPRRSCGDDFFSLGIRCFPAAFRPASGYPPVQYSSGRG